MSHIEVLQPGLLTTVQDLGRSGLLHMALSRGGAMDPAQLGLANALVGNPVDAAGLECTGMGPSLRFAQATCLATTGAPVQTVLTLADGSTHALPSHRPVCVPAGASVRWSPAGQGFRWWVAFAGGLDVPQVLGSRASHLASGVGLPRLKAKDQLHLNPSPLASTARWNAMPGAAPLRWSLPPSLPPSWPVIELLALPGRHWQALSTEDQDRLLSHTWKVSPQSNRQGLALDGPALNTQAFTHLASEPVREGTVQLPPAGRPYVLLAEHQSTGGYPRVLEVIRTMAPQLAQAGPQAWVTFKLVSLPEVDVLQRTQTQQHEALLAAIRSKLEQL